MITEQQYRRLMKTYMESGSVSAAALKAGMDRKTARRYVRSLAGPTTLRPKHDWRTRSDPLEQIWPEAERWLELAPELEAKALLEHLVSKTGAADVRVLRTFQRRVKSWRLRHGPPKEVYFPQVREPGERIQVDWTHANELGVSLGGVSFPHLLCHAVLPYSNWEWAVPCRSESMLSLKVGLQSALWAMGGVPKMVQTDHSSTATHVLNRVSGVRGFNTEYLALCEHLGLEPKTINKACPHENGDVESAHGHLKRRLRAHLTLRGSADFNDEADYVGFLAQVCTGANALRGERVVEELARLGVLPATRYPEMEEVAVRVSSYSTVRVKHTAYSVPARLIGTMVKVQINEAEVRVIHAHEVVAQYPRAHAHQPRIDYRHLIDSLVRKPGAFARYIYREELFPRPVFRQAYDQLKRVEERRADHHYVRLLALAAEAGEDRVAAALGKTLRAGVVPLPMAIDELLRSEQSDVPTRAMVTFDPELKSYDGLLEEVGT